MNVNLQYIASSGTVYNLKGDGIRTKKANYHRWNWGVEGTALQYGMRVSNFTRKPAAYETTLILDGPYDYRRLLLESLHNDFERDVRSKKMGRVIWGDYYLECFVTDSSTYPDENNIWTDNVLTFYGPYPFWIKEDTMSFVPQEAPVGEEYLDYSFDYAYDYYYGDPGIGKWIRDFSWDCNFKMIIYGPCANPQVTINGHPYLVRDTLDEADYIVIDSRQNSVTKYLASGQVLNIFDLRNKQQSVFEPIPSGDLTINWGGAFGFDLTLFEERSEPRYTDGRYAELEGNGAVLMVERW